MKVDRGKGTQFFREIEGQSQQELMEKNQAIRLGF